YPDRGSGGGDSLSEFGPGGLGGLSECFVWPFQHFLIRLAQLTPGNDTLFLLSKNIGQGKKAGIISALGIGTGSIACAKPSTLAASLFPVP
ncbi:MAG: hypothetical protein ABIQ93_10200, partial [Saprospiraceae bacterium]